MFIEFHGDDQDVVSINAEKITAFAPEGEGCRIWIVGISYFDVSESYEVVKVLLERSESDET